MRGCRCEVSKRPRRPGRRYWNSVPLLLPAVVWVSQHESNTAEVEQTRGPPLVASVDEEPVVNALLLVVVIVVVIVAAVVVAGQRRSARTRQLADARAEARRWTERLGAQVYAIDTGDNAPARQALADAAERFTAAGSQVEQATSVTQFHLATRTAYEGLYYVRAARTALELDPGPELPPLPGQQQAGQVSQTRQVDVGGHDYQASPQPGTQTPHYYPGGYVAGRPVPGGWYSQPWWKPALVAGVWGVGTYLVASALFSEMDGMGGDSSYDAGGLDGDGGGFDGDGGGFDGGGGGFDGGGGGGF